VFDVGLAYVDVQAEFLTEIDATLHEVGVRRHAVHVDLPRAQAPQIRSIEDIYLHEAISR
jgi:hypothetical protein